MRPPCCRLRDSRGDAERPSCGLARGAEAVQCTLLLWRVVRPPSRLASPRFGKCRRIKPAALSRRDGVALLRLASSGSRAPRVATGTTGRGTGSAAAARPAGSAGATRCIPHQSPWKLVQPSDWLVGIFLFGPRPPYYSHLRSPRPNTAALGRRARPAIGDVNSSHHRGRGVVVTRSGEGSCPT